MATKGNGTASKVPSKVLRQREEAEAIAKAKAERLLTPAERSVDNSPPTPTERPPEPSLAERLKRIDERALETVKAEKAGLIRHYLDESRRAFAKAIGATTDAELRKAYDDVQRLEKLATTDGPRTALEGKLFDNGGETPTRVRRSGDELKGDAEKLASWLRDNPNSKGSAATEATGVTIKPPLNLKTFLEKHGGVKVKTEGAKASTVYSLA